MIITNLPNQSSLVYKLMRPVKFKLKAVVFWVVFFLVFYFSGILRITSLPYRMAGVSLLILPLVLYYGIKWNSVLFLQIVLLFVTLLSTIWNGASWSGCLNFARISVFSYLVYYLTELYINRSTIVRVMQAYVWLASIQLPIILLQWRIYDSLPAYIRQDVILEDFGFGTFNFKSDYAMAFCLLALVIFLLFDSKRSYIVNYRWLLIIWLLLSIMVANAQFVKLIAILICLVYFITHVNPKNIFYLFVLLLIIGCIILALAQYGVLTEGVNIFVARTSATFAQLIHVNEIDERQYFLNHYDRAAAIAYFLKTDLLWIGYGPGNFNNLFNVTGGSIGHAFTFYSEVGFVGWLLSMSVFFQMVPLLRNRKLRINKVYWLLFLSICILSFTAEIMSDISAVLIYCIMAKSQLIPAYTSVLQSNTSDAGNHH